MPDKIVLIVVDGLSPAVLDRAIEDGAAPTLALLRSHDPGTAVSAFPSLTPVCLSAIATGAGPAGSRIPALQWYHRGEGRFVEYGSSFEATVVAGAKQSVDDSMMNLNHLHQLGCNSTPCIVYLSGMAMSDVIMAQEYLRGTRCEP